MGEPRAERTGGGMRPAPGRGTAEGRRRLEDAVSSVLGAVLMLAVLMTLVPGMILLRGAISDEMDAQREAAERAAWCARNPAIGPPTCDDDGPMPGYACTEVQAGAWLCTTEGAADVGPERNITGPTASPTPPSATPSVPTAPLIEDP